MDAEKISECLRRSIAGFMYSSTPTHLAKSGVFAAYCAHRMIPVVSSHKRGSADGLQAGEHYWLVSKRKTQRHHNTGQNIADNAFAWYQTHSMSMNAEMYAACFNDVQRNQSVYECT